MTQTSSILSLEFCKEILLHTYDTDMWNRQRESKNTKLYEIDLGTKLFITFELKGFSTWGEKDIIFLCWLFLHLQLSTQPTRGAGSAQSRLASPSSTFFFRGRNSTNCFFSNLSPCFRCVTSPKCPGLNSYLGFLFWHLWITNPPRARVNICVSVAPN